MKRHIKSKFLQPKPKIENSSCRWFKKLRRLHRRHKSKKPAGASGVEMEPTNLQNLNSNEVETESRDLQILNASEVETDGPALNSDVIVIGDNEKENDYKSEDDDIELQQILFYSAQFHSGKKLESISNKASGKKVVETKHSVINLENSIREKGESSCTFCEICEDAFPQPNTLIQGTNCDHHYCEECIQNYIGKEINKDINNVLMKCPVSDCMGILDLESIVPVEFLNRVGDAFRETQVLASPMVVDCPFMDCTGTFVDDKRAYPIRACPKCWRIFCIKCRALHLGMTCEDYEYKRQLNFFYWKQLGGYHDEQEGGGEEDGEETP